MSEQSRFVTALFRSPDAAERAYGAAVVLGYKDADINVVVSDATRDRLLATLRKALRSRPRVRTWAGRLAARSARSLR